MYVCGICTVDSGAFAQTLKGEMPVEVIEVACMSGCTRAQTVAFRETGKIAYLFGDIGETDIPDLRNFAALYAASGDGHFEDARPLGTLRTKALARIPGV
jgi:predicted metal-binding protein